VADEDLYVHVHIPKCAGTTVWRWLLNSHREAFRGVYLMAPPNLVLDDENLAQFIADPVVRSFSTHYVRTYEPFRCGRRTHYYTFLRDPVQQFLSYHSYLHALSEQFTDPTMLAALPPDWAHISSRDFAAWIMDQSADLPFRENYQTNYLTSVAWRKATGRGPRPTLAFDVWDSESWAAFTRDRLALAKATLRAFFFVGTVERMDESLDVLHDRLSAGGLPLLPRSAIAAENVTKEKSGDTSWISDDDPVGRRFLASVEEDRELHAFASRLLDAALAQRVE
jgi:hypothetical protein